MNTSHQIRNALAGENISFAEMNILPTSPIQHMSHRELEAELSFYIGQAKSIHIAPAMNRYSRSEKADIGSVTPGYRSAQSDARQKSWSV